MRVWEVGAHPENDQAHWSNPPPRQCFSLEVPIAKCFIELELE